MHSNNYILIGADIVPTKTNISLFKTGDVRSLVGDELHNILENASYRIFNLETPLTNVISKIKKDGPNLAASAEAISGYSAMGINLLTIANNHILDQDTQGFYSTTQLLDNAGISYVGGGNNLTEASKPYIFELWNKKFGVYACAEHEFTIATDHSCGANPFDPLNSLDHVSELKKNCNFVIVLYHGGKEEYRYPSPYLQKVCRKLIDKGANLVTCQHTHYIGCQEEYNGGTIVYGQGNFIFDNSDSEFWKTGMLIKISDDLSVSYIPFIKTGNTIRLANTTETREILSGFYSRSEDIKKEHFIDKEYANFAKTMFPSYFITFRGYRQSIIFRILNKLSGRKLAAWLSSKVTDENSLAIRNYIKCEAHRELLLAGIEKLYNAKK